MIFNTWTFALYACIVLFLYRRVIPTRYRPWFLVTAGLLFYSFAVPVYTLLIASLAAITYLSARAILATEQETTRRIIAVCAGAASVMVLIFFKYIPALASAFHFAGFSHILVPLAISFFTFEFVHFITDLYLGKIQRVALRDFALFTLFFPTMVAGPIKRYQEFTTQIGDERIDKQTTREGLVRIAYGLVKKMVVADSMTPLVAPLLTPTPAATTPDYWIGVLAYTVKIYFDFTGYSDIAIGLAYLLGYRIPENFDNPYSSRSIAEFWRRWHMSLSSWIRDYLFIPLGGSRKHPIVTSCNLIAVMAIAGLWHGAGIHFVAWGLWHGVGLAVHRGWSTLVRNNNALSLAANVFRANLARTLTFTFTALGWVLFASPSVAIAARTYRILFGFS